VGSSSVIDGVISPPDEGQNVMRANPLGDLEELLERMSSEVEAEVRGSRRIPVDVEDRDEEYVVRADLPGFDPEDLDVRLDGKRLTVEAEREDDDDETEYLRRERRDRSARRTVRLPEPVEEEGIEADLEEGVLTVRLPKRHDREGTSIEVN
jgi:HSP20 family protein